jgi:hypothetical protein
MIFQISKLFLVNKNQGIAESYEYAVKIFDDKSQIKQIPV